MGLMAVMAGHPFLKHFTLKKRSIHIDFIRNLSIGMVQPFFDQGRQIMIKKGLSRLKIFCEKCPAGMTMSTSINLSGRRRSFLTYGRIGRWNNLPSLLLERRISHRQSLGGIRP
jgi:hypothetical protein